MMVMNSPSISASAVTVTRSILRPLAPNQRCSGMDCGVALVEDFSSRRATRFSSS
jgi:hypothetical protein